MAQSVFRQVGENTERLMQAWVSGILELIILQWFVSSQQGCCTIVMCITKNGLWAIITVALYPWMPIIVTHPFGNALETLFNLSLNQQLVSSVMAPQFPSGLTIGLATTGSWSPSMWCFRSLNTSIHGVFSILRWTLGYPTASKSVCYVRLHGSSRLCSACSTASSHMKTRRSKDHLHVKR